MNERRYRSHHDSEFALKSFLNLTRPEMANEEELTDTLNSYPGKDERVIYFHVPYCDRICTFCNLNRGLKKDDLESYTRYLLEEIEKYSEYEYIKSKEFKAVYFGGGTPTTLTCKQLERILKSIERNFPLSNDVEFTFETTLHNLDYEKVKLMQDLGVNRFSVGIQTFADEGRKTLGRAFNRAETIKRLSSLREMFKGTLCIDIIYSYPGQTRENVLSDAEAAIKCDVDSISFYSLMLHDGSRLNAQIQAGEIYFDRTLESDKMLHNTFYEFILEKGFDLLELSKLVKPEKDEYRYIKLKYLNSDVLPIGIGAGGRLGDIGIYRMMPQKSMFTRKNERYDFFNGILGLMQFGKYDLLHFKEILKEKEYEAFMEKFSHFVSMGYFENNGGESFRLKSDGVFWGNNIAIELLKGIIKESSEFCPEGEDYTRHEKTTSAFHHK